MTQGQLIATLDCNTQEIILDVQGGTASGDFEVMFPDATTQTISGSLPLTVTSSFSGIHAFWNISLDVGSSLSSVLPTSIDVDYINCSQLSGDGNVNLYCLFNLNNAYEKALCKNEKLADIEKQKLDRAIQLILLMKHITECTVNQSGCNTYGCTDSTANNYNPNACQDDGSCTYTPGPITISYDCISGNCIDPGTGNGAYFSLAACQAACNASPCVGSTPCVPNTAGFCSGTVAIPNYNFEMALAFMQLDDFNFPNQKTNATTICSETSLNINLSTSNSLSGGQGNPSNGNISNFTGLEGFVSLENLSVSGHNITTFVSNNSLGFARCLREFNCAQTSLDVSTLDFTQNYKLEVVFLQDCTSNSGALPVTPANNPNLRVLRAGGLNLGSHGQSSLDLTGWTCLEQAWIYGNGLTSVNFPPSMTDITAHHNLMTTIDVSMCTGLTVFWITYCPNITDIYIGSVIDLNGLLGTFSTLGSNASVNIHVGTASRVNLANQLFPLGGPWGAGTFVI
tara:strand:+ start:1365 stop:2900 length:1536 start_codon:yes stop_codon:yes gene_type:complete